jgi:ATP-dependent helicase HrpA
MEARRSASPRLEYPADLPITQHREQLIGLIGERQVIVVCGETGSGKSTQLPKLCLEAGLGRAAMIGHTQPRRLAARSIATRIAEELDTPLGGLVGYQVRFADQTSEQTLIKLMTDGILLAETQTDRSLAAYDAIIIDEAHERSLNIDFLLGYLRRLQVQRPDLKVLITSATIDAERFAAHFADTHGPAPIVNVEGRGYPVDIEYLPWDDVVSEDSRGYDLPRHVIAGIDMASRGGGGGDMLVFLPTERDIREVSHRVAGHYKRLGLASRVELLPLYARLPQSAQQQIFHPQGGKRRIIFATNIAESSLTVPGIRYVIDTGTARISRYSARSKMQRLPIEAISRASADQRAGRCGRVGPGVCIRLYSAEDYAARDEFTTPEIRRTSLASVVLQTKALRLGKLEEFPLLDPPRLEAIREGVRTLFELGALDERQELSAVGWTLGRLPVDPRVGRIILAADEQGVLAEVLPIAAAMEIHDPRERPPDKQQAADRAHAAFADPRSDFLSYLRLWRYYEQARSDHGSSKLTRELRKRFLSPTRMREWADVYRQLREVACSSLGNGGPAGKRRSIGQPRFVEDPQQLVSDEHYAAIHRALLAGLLSGVAMAVDRNEYTGAGGLQLVLWPGSGVVSSKPKWIVAAELVETSKQFARTVARIEPSWIEQVGAHLIKRTHQQPHWSSKAGGAFCYENLLLFGLPVVSRRRVPLAPIDPAAARDLLIDHGLAEDQMQTSARFVRYNRALREAIAQLAAKTRRRDLLVDAFQVASFYQARLPSEVLDRARLEKFDRSVEPPAWADRLPDEGSVADWLQSPPAPAEGAEAATPYMRPDGLLEVRSSAAVEDFPNELAVGSSRLPLEYRFEPGSDRDGINIKVPQAAISQISQDRLGWLVPGFLETKLTAMIKALPKRIRRNLVPASDVAARIAAELKADFAQTPFLPAVCRALSRHADMPVTPADFQHDKLDPHLEFLVTVVDDDGSTVAEGRELAALQQRLAASPGDAAPAEAPSSDQSWSRSSTRSFDIDQLPTEVVCQRGGMRVAQFPALVDLGDAVATRLFPDQASAEAALRRGTMRLYAIAESKELRQQVRWLPAVEQAKIKLSGAVSAAAFESSLIDLLARIALVDGEPPVRSATAFEVRRGERGRRIASAAQEVAPWLRCFADHHFAVRSQLESLRGRGATAAGLSAAIEDVQEQLRWLLGEDFLSVTPWPWLKHYPRYFNAITYRLNKLGSGAAARDRESLETVRTLWNRWLASLAEEQRRPNQQADKEFRWMIEELRVSLFAQPLGTAVKVSPQRCEKLLQ